MLKKTLKEKVQESVISFGLSMEEFDQKSRNLTFEQPADERHGDIATNAALIFARPLNMAPYDLALMIKRELEKNFPGLERIEIAGPGFINIFLGDSYYTDELNRAYLDIDNFGKNTTGADSSVQIEFVSVNPVGPLHVGGGRWAAIGDCLANLFSYCGYRVSKEFYVNDFGNQVRLFSMSVWHHYMHIFGKKVDFPEGGYRGDYINNYAVKVKDRFGSEFIELDDLLLGKFTRVCVDLALEEIKGSLERMRVFFDVWFFESTLHESGDVDATIKELMEMDKAYEKDGALWLRTTDYGDDKDRVLVKSDGEKTYFCVDIAYHKNKKQRGFDRVIDIWGADHHGHVRRMKAAYSSLGYDPDSLELLIGQLVNLTVDGKPFKMSKRAGDIITLDELLDEVGPDVARYIFLTKSLDTMLDFDVEAARRHSADNPVYYVQYAHARIASIIKHAQFTGADVSGARQHVFGKFYSESERRLVRVLVNFPMIVLNACEHRAPNFLTAYAEELAAIFHNFYQKNRVVTEDYEVAEHRFALCLLTKEIIRKTLNLLGVSAPEKM